MAASGIERDRIAAASGGDFHRAAAALGLLGSPRRFFDRSAVLPSQKAAAE
jgi:hypothetical protein